MLRNIYGSITLAQLKVMGIILNLMVFVFSGLLVLLITGTAGAG